LRGTSYSATISRFTRRKDGRGAYLAFQSAHAGVDKWNAEIEKCESLLHTYEWKGESNYTLEKHIQAHRSAAITLENAAKHVTYLVPDEYTLVGYLLNSIKTSDPELQAAMAAVRGDKGPGGKRHSFNLAVDELQPADPVARKRKENKRTRFAEISDVQADEGKPVALKAGRGPKTGVHLRYHVRSEYNKLTKEQKAELESWRNTPEGRAAVEAEKAMQAGKTQQSGGKRQGKNRRNVSVAEVRKHVKSELEKAAAAKLAADETESKIHSILSSLVPAGGHVRQAASASSADAAMADAKKQLCEMLLAKAKNS